MRNSSSQRIDSQRLMQSSSAQHQRPASLNRLEHPSATRRVLQISTDLITGQSLLYQEKPHTRSINHLTPPSPIHPGSTIRRQTPSTQSVYILHPFGRVRTKHQTKKNNISAHHHRHHHYQDTIQPKTHLNNNPSPEREELRRGTTPNLLRDKNNTRHHNPNTLALTHQATTKKEPSPPLTSPPPTPSTNRHHLTPANTKQEQTKTPTVDHRKQNQVVNHVRKKQKNGKNDKRKKKKKQDQAIDHQRSIGDAHHHHPDHTQPSDPCRNTTSTAGQQHLSTENGNTNTKQTPL
ncbi:hypothetical protein QL285_070650 [Trifolium repens]|nr:hypothetical protein QL285_070650 [Trifolium repens]